MPETTIWLALGALNGFLGVGLGALGAHGLATVLDAQQAAWFHKATYYQELHALALLATGLWLRQEPGRRLLHWAGAAFALGVLWFCGGLYILALGGARGWGLVVPFGGVAFLLGWGLLAVAALRRA